MSAPEMPSRTLDKCDISTRIVPVQKAFSLFTRRSHRQPVHGFRLRAAHRDRQPFAAARTHHVLCHLIPAAKAPPREILSLCRHAAACGGLLSAARRRLLLSSKQVRPGSRRIAPATSRSAALSTGQRLSQQQVADTSGRTCAGDPATGKHHYAVRLTVLSAGATDSETGQTRLRVCGHQRVNCDTSRRASGSTAHHRACDAGCSQNAPIKGN
jgi:hypothetical protein